MTGMPSRVMLLQVAVLNLHNAAVFAAHGRGFQCVQCLLATRMALVIALAPAE